MRREVKMKAAKKAKKPSHFQTAILAQIARSPLMKTYDADHKAAWSLQNGTAISSPTAEALIRNGWVKPQRDGLGLFDEGQTYFALKPRTGGA